VAPTGDRVVADYSTDAADAIDASAVLAAIGTTRSIRRYRPDPVPEEDLTTMLWAATRAPNASNTQPARFVVLRRHEANLPVRQFVGDAFRVYWDAKASNERWWEGSGADADTPKGRAARTMQYYVDHFEEIPVVVLVCMLPLRPIDARYVGSVYPACQNLLLAARALGYGGTLAMFHMHVEKELKAMVGIPDEVFLAGIITLGRPAGHHGPLRRKPLADVVFDERWGEPAEWLSAAPAAD
jgi:nitroreductase